MLHELRPQRMHSHHWQLLSCISDAGLSPTQDPACLQHCWPHRSWDTQNLFPFRAGRSLKVKREGEMLKHITAIIWDPGPLLISSKYPNSPSGFLLSPDSGVTGKAGLLIQQEGQQPAHKRHTGWGTGARRDSTQRQRSSFYTRITTCYISTTTHSKIAFSLNCLWRCFRYQVGSIKETLQSLLRIHASGWMLPSTRTQSVEELLTAESNTTTTAGFIL